MNCSQLYRILTKTVGMRYRKKVRTLKCDTKRKKEQLSFQITEAKKNE
jgi:hypothetical protein